MSPHDDERLIAERGWPSIENISLPDAAAGRQGAQSTDSFLIGKLSVVKDLSLAEAADRIGVSQRQARNLVTSGNIVLTTRGVVDADSISAFLRDRGLVARRVWSEETAWAAIGLLAGIDISRGTKRLIADALKVTGALTSAPVLVPADSTFCGHASVAW